MSVIVVAAEVADIQFAFELGVEFHSELQAAAMFPPLDPARVVGALQQSQAAQGLFIAVDTARGLPIGCVAMIEMDYWYADAKFATDLMFYVSPAGRGTGAAKLLLEKAKEWASERDLNLMMAVTAGGRVEAKDKFFARRGLPRIGGMYLMTGA